MFFFFLILTFACGIPVDKSNLEICTVSICPLLEPEEIHGRWTLEYRFHSRAISATPIPGNKSEIFQTFCPTKQNAWKIILYPSLPIFTTARKATKVVGDEEERGLHKNGYH